MPLEIEVSPDILNAITNEVEAYYVGKHGLDTNDGRNIEQAFLTFGAAIAAAAAQVPAANNRFSIICHDGGTYTEDLTVPEYVTIDAPDATLIGNHTITQNAKMHFQRYEATAGFCVHKNAGAGSCCVKGSSMYLSGAASGLVCTSGDMCGEVQYTNVENGYGAGSTSTGDIHMRFGYVFIRGTGFGVGLAAGGTGHLALTINCIEDNGGAGTAVRMFAGTAHITVANIDCATTWNVNAGANLYLNAGQLDGNGVGVGNVHLQSVPWRFIRTTDNLVAIIGAANAGDHFMLQEGVHLVTATVNVTDADVVIEGPRGAIVRYSTAGFPCFTIGATRVTLRGFTIEATAAATGDAIRASAAATRCVYDDLHFSWVPAGVNAYIIRYPGDDTLVHRCQTTGEWYMLVYNNAGDRVRIIGNYVAQADFYGVDLQGTVYDCIVANNVFYNIQNVGVNLLNSVRCIVANNIIEDANGQAIHLAGTAQRNIVTGNIESNCAEGITIEANADYNLCGGNKLPDGVTNNNPNGDNILYSREVKFVRAAQGFEDLVAGVTEQIAIPNLTGIRGILRARFWIGPSGGGIGAAVRTRITLNMFCRDNFLHAEYNTYFESTLLAGYPQFDFRTVDLDVAAAQGDARFQVDSIAGFVAGDLVRVRDANNFEFQRVSGLDGVTTDLDLEDTVIPAAGWAIDDDVARVMELGNLSYEDEDETGELHLEIIPEAGDDNCRLYWAIEYLGRAED